MRHHDNKRVLGREHGQRQALLRSLVRSLVLHERVRTTEARAKALRPVIEKLVTKSRNGDVAARRVVMARIGDKKLTRKLVDEIAPRYRERAGGYTRIIKLPPRASDAARMAVIEFV